MKETERFIRHVLPGMTLIIVLIILLMIYDTRFTILLLKKLEWGNILGSIIISGGIGFLLSKFYWGFINLTGYPIDHTTALNHLIENNKLIIKNLSGGTENRIKNNRDGWSLINSYWYVFSNEPKLKNIQERIDRLSDILHGTGTAIIASTCGFLSYLALIFFLCKNEVFQNVNFYWSLIVFGIIFLLLIINYIRTKEMYSLLINNIIIKSIEDSQIQVLTLSK